MMHYAPLRVGTNLRNNEIVILRRIIDYNMIARDVLDQDFITSSIKLFRQELGSDRLVMQQKYIKITEGTAKYIVYQKDGVKKAYITYFEPKSRKSSEAGQRLLEQILQDIHENGCSVAWIFIESRDNYENLFENHNFIPKRRFPIQLVWSNLPNLWGNICEPQVKIDTTMIAVDDRVAAELFVDAFSDQWEWYFEQIGGKRCLLDKNLLVDVGKLFLQRADHVIVASVSNEVAGISALNVDKGALKGTFHTGVGVLPKYRGKRIGSYLTYNSLKWLMDSGVVTAEVRTQSPLEDYYPQISIYTKLGAEKLREFTIYEAIIND